MCRSAKVFPTKNVTTLQFQSATMCLMSTANTLQFQTVSRFLSNTVWKSMMKYVNLSPQKFKWQIKEQFVSGQNQGINMMMTAVDDSGFGQLFFLLNFTDMAYLPAYISNISSTKRKGCFLGRRRWPGHIRSSFSVNFTSHTKILCNTSGSKMLFKSTEKHMKKL